MKTDIQIAQESQLNKILDVATSLGLSEEEKNKYIENYGHYKAKIDFKIKEKYADKKDGKVILVTSINPTPAGEGKTTTTIGLTDALRKLGTNTVAALREPSLGPVFGVKGGATGGGYSQVVPMEDINLHFTGDFHAIGAANNLLAAMIDNHIFQGNELNIDNRRIILKRAVDMNDRQLRSIINGLDGKMNGVPRQDGYEITVAGEIMAVLCLSKDIDDLKERLGRMIVAYTKDGTAVTADKLKAVGAMAALLKDAIKPNLVQTLEHSPVIIHGGPFANIAHGCNSVIATKTAMKLADYVVTEAGFGADLGAEKFLDIKCRIAKIKPSAVVIVATVRALKYHGGVAKENLDKENLEALKTGLPNLLQHIGNIKDVYQLPCVVAVNVFPTDTENEMELLMKECEKTGVKAYRSDVWAKGSKGGVKLAKAVLELCEKDNEFSFSYEETDSIEDKLNKIAVKIYHATGVELAASAKKDLADLESLGFSHLPVCVAKTQYSFSDNPKLLAAPKDFKIAVRNFKVSAGAGFIVAYTGNIMTMPGLPKIPAAENIDMDNNGKITGLF